MRPATVLQFGSGNFLRGFVDWFLQQSNEAGLTDHSVAIAYATNRPGRRREPLIDQGGRYHVVLEGIRDGEPVRRIDAVDVIDQIIDPFADYAAYADVALSPDLEVVLSNTTEAGISYVADDDLAARPAASFPAIIAQLLHDRFVAFDGADEAGLAIVPCELIEANGTTLREYVVRHAGRAGWGEDFLTWLDRANEFYDTLVDRIVSGFPDDAPAIQAELGVTDNALVKGELFSLWVIGGDAERLRRALPLDRLGLGVEFVPREAVAPYRDKKVRVLNGCHTAMAALGPQLDAAIVRDAFADADLRRYLHTLIDTEVLPTIDGDSDALRGFAAAILERFDNPFLQHRLADISLNSSAKWKARNLPVLLDRWRAGQDAPLTVFSLAALLVLYSGQASAAGFVPRDDAAILDAVSAGFDADDVPGWVRRSLTALGLADLPELDRLVDETAAAASVIIGEGARQALVGLLDGVPA